MSDKEFVEKGAELPANSKTTGEPSVLDEVAGLLSEEGYVAPEHDNFSNMGVTEKENPSLTQSNSDSTQIQKSGDTTSTGTEKRGEHKDESKTDERTNAVEHSVIHHVKPSKFPAIISSVALILSVGLAASFGYERYKLGESEAADSLQLDNATNAIFELTEAVGALNAELEALNASQTKLLKQSEHNKVSFENDLQNYLKTNDFEMQLDKFNVVTDIKDVEVKFQESLLSSLELASSQATTVLSENQKATKIWVTDEVDTKIDYMLEHVGEVVAGLKLDNDRHQRTNSSLKARVESIEKHLINLNAENISKKN